MCRDTMTAISGYPFPQEKLVRLPETRGGWPQVITTTNGLLKEDDLLSARLSDTEIINAMAAAKFMQCENLSQPVQNGDAETKC